MRYFLVIEVDEQQYDTASNQLGRDPAIEDIEFANYGPSLWRNEHHEMRLVEVRKEA